MTVDSEKIDTPDELVKRLRDISPAVKLAHEAADRIEALIADRDAWCRDARSYMRRIAELGSHIHEMESTVPHSTIIGLREELRQAHGVAQACEQRAEKAERRADELEQCYAELQRRMSRMAASMTKSKPPA